MPKVTIQDVTDAGFKAAQFGTPADFLTPTTGYLARAIAEAAIWMAGRVGQAAYDATLAGTAQVQRLKRAELCWVKAELWTRRAAFLDANAFTALEGNPSAAAERRSYLEHAATALECALNNVDLFLTGGDAAAPGSGATIGHVESGPYRVDGTVPGLAR